MTNLVAESAALSVERVLVANPHGYCAGVLFALRGADLARQIYPDRPVWVYHEIVHNPDPVSELRAQGVEFCDDLAQVPDGAVVLFSAHGVSPAVRAQAADRAFHTVIDLTCPLVARVHDAVRRNAQREVILVGKRSHDETVGTMGEVPERTHVVSSIADVEALALEPSDNIVFVTQTTWSIQDASAIIAAIHARYPQARPAIATSGTALHASICYATENRQQAVVAGAQVADFVLVIGGDRSENTANLVHTAVAAGARGLRIQDVSELRQADLAGARVVLVSSGASTPEYRLEETIAWFRQHGVRRIESLGEPEQMQRLVPNGFELPAALRSAVQRHEATTGVPLQAVTRAAQPWRGTVI